MGLYTTRAIILNRCFSGETSQIYTALSEKLGKIQFQAQGVKNITSKLAGHLEPLNYVVLTIISGSKKDKLIGALLLDSYLHLKSNFFTLTLANFAREVLDKYLKLRLADEGCFNLTRDFFTFLNNKALHFKLTYPQFIFLALSFFVKIMKEQGFLPDLDRCGQCNRILEREDIFWDLESFKITHINCAETPKKKLRIEKDILNNLRKSLYLPWSDLAKEKLTHSQGLKFKKILVLLSQIMIEVPLNTLNFLKI